MEKISREIFWKDAEPHVYPGSEIKAHARFESAGKHLGLTDQPSRSDPSARLQDDLRAYHADTTEQSRLWSANEANVPDDHDSKAFWDEATERLRLQIATCSQLFDGNSLREQSVPSILALLKAMTPSGDDTPQGGASLPPAVILIGRPGQRARTTHLGSTDDVPRGLRILLHNISNNPIKLESEMLADSAITVGGDSSIVRELVFPWPGVVVESLAGFRNQLATAPQSDARQTRLNRSNELVQSGLTTLEIHLKQDSDRYLAATGRMFANKLKKLRKRQKRHMTSEQFAAYARMRQHTEAVESAAVQDALYILLDEGAAWYRLTAPETEGREEAAHCEERSDPLRSPQFSGVTERSSKRTVREIEALDPRFFEPGYTLSTLIDEIRGVKHVVGRAHLAGTAGTSLINAADQGIASSDHQETAIENRQDGRSLQAWNVEVKQDSDNSYQSPVELPSQGARMAWRVRDLAKKPTFGFNAE
jgi:hypothetical protein